MLSDQSVVAQLFLCLVLLQLARAILPSGCLVASDIISCTNLGLERIPASLPAMASVLDFNHNHLQILEEGSFASLPNLETLRLAHNKLTRLIPGTFRNTSSIQHLDLSSNKLNVIKQYYFQGLVGIKELLLYNNRIVRVESKALSGLRNLRKTYLSHNRLTDFPFFSIQEHPNLITLDLSSNRMPNLPVDEIADLAKSVQKGLYLHNNSLVCECPIVSMFKEWEHEGFTSVQDFRENHTCLLYGELLAPVRFLQNKQFFKTCKETPLVRMDSLEVRAGHAVTLDCKTPFHGTHLNYVWVSPQKELIAPPGNNNSLKMHPNGSLQVLAAQEENSGVYVCLVLNHQDSSNATHKVNLTVVMDVKEEELFNTGFTTLLGCAVSLVLVLIYLYLTPFCCWCKRHLQSLAANLAPNKCNAQPSILVQSSSASTESPANKANKNKHVVFLEPVKETLNEKARGGRSNVDSVTSVPMSVFSDVTVVS